MEEYHRDFFKRVLAHCVEAESKDILNTQNFFKQLLFLRNEAIQALPNHFEELERVETLRSHILWLSERIPNHINQVKIQAFAKRTQLLASSVVSAQHHQKYSKRLEVLVQQFCKHTWKGENPETCIVCWKLR
jgi:hypothetical protein